MSALAAAAAAQEELAAAAAATPYTSCYCEENTYLLLDRLHTTTNCYAVFVSNRVKRCPVWHQRAARSPNVPVLWDYHVFALAAKGGAFYAVDADTTLDVATPASDYVSAALDAGGAIREYGLRTAIAILPPTKVRVVGARDFLDHFSSDRRHMADESGGFTSPPPPHAPIRGSKAASAWTLGEFWDVETAFPCDRGTTYDVPAFRRFLKRGVSAEPSS